MCRCPRRYGVFDVRAFEVSSGQIYLALSQGALDRRRRRPVPVALRVPDRRCPDVAAVRLRPAVAAGTADDRRRGPRRARLRHRSRGPRDRPREQAPLLRRAGQGRRYRRCKPSPRVPRRRPRLQRRCRRAHQPRRAFDPAADEQPQQGRGPSPSWNRRELDPPVADGTTPSQRALPTHQGVAARPRGRPAGPRVDDVDADPGRDGRRRQLADRRRSPAARPTATSSSSSPRASTVGSRPPTATPSGSAAKPSAAWRTRCGPHPTSSSSASTR